jgi:hypothetical protein
VADRHLIRVDRVEEPYVRAVWLSTKSSPYQCTELHCEAAVFTAADAVATMMLLDDECGVQTLRGVQTLLRFWIEDAP